MKLSEQQIIDSYLDSNNIAKLQKILSDNQSIEDVYGTAWDDGCTYGMSLSHKEYNDEDITSHISYEVLRRENINPFLLLPYLKNQGEATALYFNKFYNEDEYNQNIEELNNCSWKYSKVDGDIWTRTAISEIRREIESNVPEITINNEINNFIIELSKSLKNVHDYLDDNICTALTLYNVNNKVISYDELSDIEAFIRITLQDEAYRLSGNWDASRTMDRDFCNKYPSLFNKHGNCYYFRGSEKLHNELDKILPESLKVLYEEEPKHYVDLTEERKKERKKDRRKQKVLSMFRIRQ